MGGRRERIQMKRQSLSKFHLKIFGGKTLLLFGLCIPFLQPASLSAQGSPWLEFHPEIKWAYASSGIYLDRWAGTGPNGNDLSWKAKDRGINRPQTSVAVTLGGAIAINSKIGISLGIPYFYSQFAPDRSGLDLPQTSRNGIGDIDLGFPLKFGKMTIQPQLAFPGTYHPNTNDPWTGFGVYRGSLGVSYPLLAHYFWGQAEMVLHQAFGDNKGIAEAGDYTLKGGYAYKKKLAPKIFIKGGLDLSYASIVWEKNYSALTNFTADPKISVSTLPWAKQELAFTVAATAYSRQDGGDRMNGNGDIRSYGSRHIFFGLYWGRYF